ncbi:MAG: SRPBCC domain-containing protein [Anaerolineae bacterium]|nr:SRPBCC domain-containing protein [Anaerolineae bacterium]
MSDRKVERSTLIDATPEMAFEAVTRASELREWMCDYAWTVLQPKGAYQVRWDSGYQASGRFVELDPPRRAVITWQGTGEPGETTVTFTVEPEAGGTRVTIVHAGFGPSPEWDAHVAASEKGWDQGLDNLKSTLETGTDLRIASRPFMGILFDVLNAERAAKEGIAVNEGVYINDTIEGSGARAAGLVKGDVIVSLDGVATPGYHELGPILSRHHAGDTIEAVVVHGQERRTIALTLGQRPVEETPPTADDLANRVAELYAETDVALKAAVEGLTDDEASRSPAKGEWSVKEVLAHLSITERDQQCFGFCVAVDGFVDTGPGDPAALSGRLAAALEITPTLDGMVSRFLADEAETVALIRRLPATTVAHKARFHRLSQYMVGLPAHTKEHIGQIKATIQAVRAG